MRAGHPRNRITAALGVARPQGERPAAVFYPLGYPTPYGPGRHKTLAILQDLHFLFSRLCRSYFRIGETSNMQAMAKASSDRGRPTRSAVDFLWHLMLWILFVFSQSFTVILDSYSFNFYELPPGYTRTRITAHRVAYRPFKMSYLHSRKAWGVKRQLALRVATPETAIRPFQGWPTYRA
jgi:hypothetical protein